nr:MULTISPECIES: hypothetical protein [Gordonia]
MACGNEFGEYRQPDRELATETDPDKESAGQQNLVVRRDRTDQAAECVDEQVQAQRSATAPPIRDVSTDETPDQAADDRGGVDARQLGVSDVKAVLDETAHRAGRVLLETVEELPRKQQREDGYLYSAETDAIEGTG